MDIVPRVQRRRYDYGPLVEGARVATTIAGAVPGARELARGVKRTYNSIVQYADELNQRRGHFRSGASTSRFEQRIGVPRNRLGPPQRVPNPDLGPPRPPDMPPRLAAGGPAGGVKFSKEEHIVGKKRRRQYVTMSDLLCQMERARYRWQLCSNTLTGPGRIPLSYGSYGVTDVDFHTLPIHFMSLSQVPLIQIQNENPNKGSFRHGLYRVVRNAIDGRIGTMHYWSNGPNGVNSYDTNGYWQPEVPIPSPVLNNPVYHKWSQVKLNLYGAKHIPITYTITLVKCPKQFDPLKTAPSGPVDAQTAPNPTHGRFDEFSRWVEDVSRTLLCNPINEPGTKKEYKENVKIVKQYSTTIQPMSYTNAAAEGQAPVKVGNVREFNMFVRHDRWRDYSWAEQQENIVEDVNWQDLGWDQREGIDRQYTDEKWGKRLYMFITCTTGAITDGPHNNVRSNEPYQMEDIPNDFGTYDIIVRNEFYCNQQ